MENVQFLTEQQRSVLESLDLDQCREAIGLLQNRINSLFSTDYQSYLKKNIKDLGLSTRTFNLLFYNKMTTVGDLIDYGLENICTLRGCGTKSNIEIKSAVNKFLPPST
jgi:DNA-directed RNA polymerase alpha subunit